MRIQEFDYNIDILQALLWKYSNTTNLLGLMQGIQSFIDLYQTQFWEDWYNDVFNILTANSFGLSVWSYILNTPLYLSDQIELPTKPNFGFNAYNPSFPTLLNSYLNFNNSNFSTIGTVLTLTEEEQRFLLRLVYYKYSGKLDVISINDFLNYLCSTSNIQYSGTIYVLDGLDMSETYVFTASNFPPNLLQIIQDLDALPRPAGVMINYVINTGKIFGFGIYNQNFNNGNFIHETS